MTKAKRDGSARKVSYMIVMTPEQRQRGNNEKLQKYYGASNFSDLLRIGLDTLEAQYVKGLPVEPVERVRLSDLLAPEPEVNSSFPGGTRDPIAEISAMLEQHTQTITGLILKNGTDN